MRKILINRTDRIGDVLLTLPLLGALKKQYPNAELSFLCQNYTLDIAKLSPYIDKCISAESLLKENPEEQNKILQKFDTVLHVHPSHQWAKASRNIPLRIGSYKRWYHWIYCNKLVALHRKNSPLHETQLNFKILKPLGINSASLQELQFWGRITPPKLNQKVKSLINENKLTLAIHPGSLGSTQEWPEKLFRQLITMLPDKWQPILTGSAEEAKRFHSLSKMCTSSMGKLSLLELTSLLANSHAFVGNGTGPLHISAALGINCLGIYPNFKNLGSRRWAPLSPKGKSIDSPGKDIAEINPKQVMEIINTWGGN